MSSIETALPNTELLLVLNGLPNARLYQPSACRHSRLLLNTYNAAVRV